MPAEEIPVNLIETRGQLIPPQAGQRATRRPPVAPPKPPVADAAKKEEEQEPHPDNCKHCGWNPKIDPQEPDENDAVAFRDAVFSGELFTKTVELVAGAVTVVFRDLTANEEECVKTKVILEAIKDPTLTGLMADRFDELRFSLAVVSVRTGEKRYVSEIPEDPYSADLDERHKSLRSFCRSDTVYQALRGQHRRFRSVMVVLMSRAHERSFFVATGSGGGSPVSPSAG